MPEASNQSPTQRLFRSFWMAGCEGADHINRSGQREFQFQAWDMLSGRMAPELGGAPRAIVCDCMDELSAFKNAPQQLMQRESALFRMANVVFTGGPSLYRMFHSGEPLELR